MFAVYSGQVKVTIEPGNREVARTDPGGFFGEMSLLTGDPRTATVSATCDSVLLEIPADSFRQIALAQPAVVEAVGVAVVARRADWIRRARRRRCSTPRSANRPGASSAASAASSACLAPEGPVQGG